MKTLINVIVLSVLIVSCFACDTVKPANYPEPAPQSIKAECTTDSQCDFPKFCYNGSCI